MAIIPVAEWVPDAAALGNPGSLRIENAVPGPTGYKPFPQLDVITNALDARPRGAISALDNALVTYLYAGDAAKLYSLSGTTWGDVSKSGGYSTGTEERWEFTRWKNQILATNYSDNIQTIEMGGTNFADLTTDFKARHIAVVRDFVVAGNTTDTTDGAQIDRIRWSAFNDATDWTVSSTTGSDVRDLNAGGKIQAIIGGEYGVIVSERSTWRMSYTGAPTWFQIDEVLPGVGSISAGAVGNLGDTIYFLSEHGFVALTNGTQATYIGGGRVDQFMLNDLDLNFKHRMSVVADPKGGRIAWAYPGAGNTEGRPNRVIIYDRNLNKWSTLNIEVELLWRASGVGTTLEGLDSFSSSIDALGVSLDSTQWKGGAPEFAAFDTDFKHGLFTGAPMTATIETKETEIHAGHRTLLNGFRPLLDGGSVTARVGTRDNMGDAVTESAWLSQRDSGRITTRQRARYHRFILEISGEWEDVIGVQVDAPDARKADRRG